MGISHTSARGAMKTAAAVLMLAGCGGAAATSGTDDSTSARTWVDAIHDVEIAHPLDAPAERALMVFLCPADCPPTVIVSSTGAMVAQISAHGRALVEVEPGPVTFYALEPSEGDRISGEVRAGGTYFATVSRHASGGPALRFMTLGPASIGDRWAHLGEFLTDTHEQEILAADRAALDEQVTTAELQPRMSALDTRAGEMDAEHQAERTILPDDGTAPRP
jgi:hypothetical protein